MSQQHQTARQVIQEIISGLNPTGTTVHLPFNHDQTTLLSQEDLQERWPYVTDEYFSNEEEEVEDEGEAANDEETTSRIEGWPTISASETNMNYCFSDSRLKLLKTIKITGNDDKIFLAELKLQPRQKSDYLNSPECKHPAKPARTIIIIVKAISIDFDCVPIKNYRMVPAAWQESIMWNTLNPDMFYGCVNAYDPNTKIHHHWIFTHRFENTLGNYIKDVISTQQSGMYAQPRQQRPVAAVGRVGSKRPLQCIDLECDESLDQHDQQSQDKGYTRIVDALAQIYFYTLWPLKQQYRFCHNDFKEDNIGFDQTTVPFVYVKIRSDANDTGKDIILRIPTNGRMFYLFDFCFTSWQPEKYSDTYVGDQITAVQKISVNNEHFDMCLLSNFIMRYTLSGFQRQAPKKAKLDDSIAKLDPFRVGSISSGKEWDLVAETILGFAKIDDGYIVADEPDVKTDVAALYRQLSQCCNETFGWSRFLDICVSMYGVQADQIPVGCKYVVTLNMPAKVAGL